MAHQQVRAELASAKRVSGHEIERQRGLFEDRPLMIKMLDAVPDIVLVLNRERQIVYANQSLCRNLNIKDEEKASVFGMRPGEVWQCAHAFESESGCGTTVFCGTCGAAKAIVSSQKNMADVQECRIIQDQKGDALDLRIWANPLDMGGTLFTVVTVTDISHEKRREFLERIFFHDILNTAGGLRGSAELIREASPGELDEFKDIILRLSNDLIEEIQAQQQLAAAENEALAAHPSAFNTWDFLEEIANTYTGHEVARGRHIRIADESYGRTIITDRALLRRVVGNMVKNALEASPCGGTVTIGCEATDRGIAFWVHNAEFMELDTQLQIFQRSFSTKGTGRGLGTYSIKLLTERYLKGRVSFITSPEKGTVFKTVCPNLPLEKRPDPDTSTPATKRNARFVRVLIAEDNPVNQKLMVRMVERQGHSAVVANNGKAALKALEQEPFDLVLMDCQMPEMDGFLATKAIRKSPKIRRDVPIVAMTGHTGEENREACLSAGMNDHVSKPVEKKALEQILARWT